MDKEEIVRLWEEHIAHEFQTHDTEATLETMVADAYVNHIPVMTGGRGRDALRAFYSQDFIPTMPPDTKIEPVSRTVGEHQLVDEMIFSLHALAASTLDVARCAANRSLRARAIGCNCEFPRWQARA